MEERAHSFGYWLRRRRKALDLTQKALAETVSCSHFAIRKIEADERRPSRGLAERLADKLSVPSQDRAAFLKAARAVRSAGSLSLDRLPRDGIADATPDATPFVGREKEFQLLAGLAARLTEGSGHVAMVEGEPGIGKSRLLQELARYAAIRDLPILATQCYEIERAMAYQPVIDLVTKALEQISPEALEKLGPVAAAEIAALVPAIAERIPVPSLSNDFPQARQARLFRAIVQLFEASAGERPVSVMIDDIQWADDASLQFLQSLARHSASRPLLLVCAYRVEELDAQERLSGLVQGLRRERHARHVPLARLHVSDAEALIDGLGDAKLRVPGLAARLHRETDGNPFFLVTMLHSLAQDEAPVDLSGELPLPDALRASVRARISQVDAAARSALDAAAVIGRRFDFETLLAATRKPEEELLPALEALVRGRLLREASGDGFYDFTHDKVREVVYREIVGARRIALHRAVAEALEQRAEGEAHERDAWLAGHYERAHAWRTALQYALLAAERSEKLFAMRDALHWLDRAVALGEAHPDAVDVQTLMTLYGKRGAARALAGHIDGAVADIRRVIDDARARGDRAMTRDAFIQLGMAHRRADDYPQATQCLGEALAESRAMNDERRAADTLYHLGTVMWSQGRNGEAIAAHAEAVEICERLGLTDLVAVQAYHGHAEAHNSNLEPAVAIADTERSNMLARAIGEKSYESENLMNIGFFCTGYMGLGDYRRAEASFEAALAIARAADLQWHLGPILLGLNHVRACIGKYGEAWDGMMETLRWLESVKQTRYQLIAYDFLGRMLLDLGLYGEAVEHIERGLALATQDRITFWRPRVEANLAIAKLRMGDLDVGPSLERARDDCSRNSERMQMTRCMEALAELALARGDPATCLAIAGELLALAEGGGLRELAAQARRWRGEALLALADYAQAREELGRAARSAEQIGRLRLAADAHAALARACDADHAHAEARRHEAEAHEVNARISASLAGSAHGAMYA